MATVSEQPPQRWTRSVAYPDMWLDPDQDPRGSGRPSPDGELATLQDYLTHYRRTVLLDVDNGPDFLVHDANAGLYEGAGIAEAVRVLRPSGTLAVWSMADSPALRDALAEHLQDVQAGAVPVRLQGREEAYWVLTGRHWPGDIVRA